MATGARHKLVIRVVRSRPSLIVAACLATFGLAGCAVAGTSTSAETQTPPAPKHHHPTRHRHGHRRARPKRKPAQPRGRGAPSLAPSTASPVRIQPQPSSGSCHARGTGRFSLPDRHCTPGAIDPRVTQADIETTICRVGYTKTVRPAESITEPEKEASLVAYGDTRPLHYYEYDHLVPLELGGAPNDPRNLWPEPGASPNPKDSLENRLRELVCERTVSLASAQLQIARDWITAYHRLVQ